MLTGTISEVQCAKLSGMVLCMQHFLEEFQQTKTVCLCFKNAFTLNQIEKQFCMKLCNTQGGQCQLNIQITQVETPVIKDNPRLVFRKPNNLDFHMALPPTL